MAVGEWRIYHASCDVCDVQCGGCQHSMTITTSACRAVQEPAALAIPVTGPGSGWAVTDRTHAKRRPICATPIRPGQTLTSAFTRLTLNAMEVHLTPELQAKLDKLATETGRAKDELVQDAMAGYLDELAQVRGMLDSRYDDIKSGKVKLIDGEEAFDRLRQKNEARHTDRA